SNGKLNRLFVRIQFGFPPPARSSDATHAPPTARQSPRQCHRRSRLPVFVGARRARHHHPPYRGSGGSERWLTLRILREEGRGVRSHASPHGGGGGGHGGTDDTGVGEDGNPRPDQGIVVRVPGSAGKKPRPLPALHELRRLLRAPQSHGTDPAATD